MIKHSNGRQFCAFVVEDQRLREGAPGAPRGGHGKCFLRRLRWASVVASTGCQCQSRGKTQVLPTGLLRGPPQLPPTVRGKTHQPRTMAVFTEVSVDAEGGPAYAMQPRQGTQAEAWSGRERSYPERASDTLLPTATRPSQRRKGMFTLTSIVCQVETISWKDRHSGLRPPRACLHTAPAPGSSGARRQHGLLELQKQFLGETLWTPFRRIHVSRLCATRSHCPSEQEVHFPSFIECPLLDALGQAP